jgi:acyl-[acyl-carrier-protein]-phospholipid O-acyltransferase/long-chain-fatty-acid--[acyl-carrier-protein] ligase
MAIGKFTDVLKLRGFQPFLWTQFLGALNDNLYKTVVSLLAVEAALNAGGGTQFLSMAQGLFILPFILFSGYAAYFADTYSKRSVLIATKSFEILVMGLAVIAFVTGGIGFMLAVLFLMATQSAFFGPAKYGILPEMLTDRDLSRGNALLQMTTFVAIILGTALASYFTDSLAGRLWVVGLLLAVIAVAGVAASLGIARVPPSGTHRPFRINPWSEVVVGLRRLWSDRPLWLTVVGISYFWFLGALLYIAVLVFGKESLQADNLRVGLLMVFFAVGIGVGSMAAGRLSGDKVELGLVPLGAIGMGVFAILLSRTAPSYPWAAATMTALGFSGGFFIVPLNAFLQQRAGREERGRLIAAAGFLTNVAILVASLVTWVLSERLGFRVDQTILLAGILTLLGTVYVLKVLPDFLIRFLLWLLTHTIYRIRIEGQQHVPFRGPALLVCNHISFVDGFLVGASIQRFVRFMVYRAYYESKWFHWVLRLMNTIPVAGGNRREIVESLERAREELRQGHVVCIFAEGSLSRTGNLLPFKRGFERIVKDLDVPVIPVHLDRLWGSVFSFSDGQFFWKWPKNIPFAVTVSFGTPQPSSAKAHEVRQAISELGAEAAELRCRPNDLLDRRFIRTARRRWFSFCMADSTGKELTHGKTLIGSLALSRWIRRSCRGEEMVGLLLPSSVGGALANIAVLMAGKVPVNLNFTAGAETMKSAAEQCGIRTILTSQRFLKKAKLDETPGMVFLERVMKEVAPAQKIAASVAAVVLPSGILSRLYTPEKRDSSSLATVIFSSGSTGTPKGVMLSHQNILSNLESIAQVYWVTEKDCIVGVLPFFHSFGFTVTLWFPLLSGFAVAYHPNPLDAKTIGEMVAKYKATFLLSTPTFFSAYLRKCSVEQFASLRHAIVGAEKLREPLADAFREKFGVELLEGYGCTELAPVVAVNAPDYVARGVRQTGHKFGTVGHPIPGVAVRVIDIDNGEPLPPNKEGMLLVKGPNVMKGYLRRPEQTEEVLTRGWYRTGDVAVLDDEGFLRITDRLSRFSKIGGEMVPHIKVEETVSRVLGDQPCAVTAVPDEQKGERLVVFFTDTATSPEDLSARLADSELPKLWVPKRGNFYHVDEIPMLGTGKTDLKRIRAMASEMAL